MRGEFVFLQLDEVELKINVTQLSAMYTYPLRKLSLKDVEDFLQHLKQAGIPVREEFQNDCRVIGIGAENEYVLQLSGKSPRQKAAICIRYEHPGLKQLLVSWSERRKIHLPTEVFQWHRGLAPSVIAALRQRWQMDLHGLEPIPMRLGKQVLVFTFANNVTSELAAQLRSFPQRQLTQDDFIRCAEFTVSGDDPSDTTVYAVKDSAGAVRLVTISDTPAMTLLSLWVTAGSPPLETNPPGLSQGRLD